MSNSHLIKSSSNTLFLGWFVLASALAHFVFIAQNDGKIDKHVELSFSTPLTVTVISSRSKMKQQTATTSISSPSNEASKNPKDETKKSLKNILSSQAKQHKAQSTSGPIIISKKIISSKKEELVITPAIIISTDAVETSTQHDKLRNHLQNQLRQAIKARFTYPRMARRMNWEGLVGISLHIEVDGSLHDIQISRTSGHKILDDNARKTIEKIARIKLASGYEIHPTDTEVDVLYRLIE